MDPRVFPLAEIYRLNTWLFHNCLRSITEEQAGARASTLVNSPGFIAAHVCDSRFALVAWLGTPLQNPLSAALAGARSIQEVRGLPPLSVILAAWDNVSGVLAERLDGLTASELDGPSPQSFPAGGSTLLGALAFLAQHDSYHIGQLAFLRKHAGLPAMTYRP